MFGPETPLDPFVVLVALSMLGWFGYCVWDTYKPKTPRRPDR